MKRALKILLGVIKIKKRETKEKLQKQQQQNWHPWFWNHRRKAGDNDQRLGEGQESGPWDGEEDVVRVLCQGGKERRMKGG